MTVPVESRNLFQTIAVLALALAALLAHPVVAQEGDEPATIDVEVRAIGLPMLEQIPYVNRLFKNFGVTLASVSCDSDSCQVVPVGQLEIACQQPCCRQVAACQVTSNSACCAGTSQEGFEGITKFELVSSLTEATSHVAALEAALEARDEFAQQREELFNSLAAVMIENAKLEARVEHLNVQLALQTEIAKTMAENARLQAKMEFVAQREQIVNAYSQSVTENRKLKAHVSKLEKKHSDLSVTKAKQAAARVKAAARTAQKLENDPVER